VDELRSDRQAGKRASVAWAAGIALVAATITSLVCGHGIPILRHDWSFPIARSAFPGAMATFYQPWLTTGIGAPQAYPATYLLGFFLQPLALFSPGVAIPALVFLCAALVASGALAIAHVLRAPLLGAIGAVLFASFNPWCYAEYIAGHLIMIAAMGLLLCLVAELLNPRPREWLIVVLAALSITQLEFFVFALVPLIVVFIVRRRHLALASLAIAAVPVAFGLASHVGSVASTPYVLQWQASESVPPLDALLLGGYFAGYTASFSFDSFVLGAVFFIFAFEAYRSFRSRSATFPLFLIAAVALVFVSGTKGAIAGAYSFAVTHITATGLFRELYDLISFAAIGYIVALVSFARRYRRYAAVTTIVAAAVVLPWFVRPPTRWFVRAAAVRPLRFPPPGDARVALYPPQQPLSLQGDGVGYDYDLFEQPGRAIPINSFIPMFPQAGALALGARGNDRWLRALGVEAVLSRPALREAINPRGHTFLLPRTLRLPPSHKIAGGYPLLGLLPGAPTPVSIGRSPLGNGIFYGDRPARPKTWTFYPVTGSRITADPKRAWVDARLAILRFPQIATRFEGAFTESPRARLAIHSAPALLAWTSGAIVDAQGDILARHSARLHWWPIPLGIRSIRCIGHCAVVGTGSPPILAREAKPVRPRTIGFSMLAPWLIHASLPAHPASTLRWNVRFQRSWALLGSLPIQHVRIDQSLNGWVLPKSGRSQSIWIVNIDAAVQLALEVLGAIATLLLALFAARTNRRDSVFS